MDFFSITLCNNVSFANQVIVYYSSQIKISPSCILLRYTYNRILFYINLKLSKFFGRHIDFLGEFNTRRVYLFPIYETFHLQFLKLFWKYTVLFNILEQRFQFVNKKKSRVKQKSFYFLYFEFNQINQSVWPHAILKITSDYFISFDNKNASAYREHFFFSEIEILTCILKFKKLKEIKTQCVFSFF